MSMVAAPPSVPLQPVPAPQTLLENGIRHDGRGVEEPREPVLQVGMITRAKGSAYVELGQTKLVAAVYGPRPSERRFGFSHTGRLHVEVGFAALAAPSRARAAVRASEKDLASAVAAALSPALDLAALPKAVAEVRLLVLEADGGVAAGAITAAALAAADAGLVMYDLVPACSVGQLQGQLLLDPSSWEEQRASGGLTVAYMPARNEVTQAQCVGCWSNSSSKEALELALGGCVALKDAMRTCLVEAAAKRQAAAAAAAAASAAAADVEAASAAAVGAG